MAGIREVVLDGKSRFTVPVNNDDIFIDRIERLITNPEQRRRFGEQARNHTIRNLNAEIAFDNVLKKIINLLN